MAPTPPEDDENGVLDSIDWRLGYWCTAKWDANPVGMYDVANIYEAYELMIERKLANKEFHEIRAFRAFAGLKIDKVEEIIVPNRYGENPATRRNLLFYAEDKILEARDWVEFVVNPYAKENVLACRNVTDEYESIIGSSIKGLRYSDQLQAVLSFDNGRKIYFVGSREGCSIIQK